MSSQPPPPPSSPPSPEGQPVEVREVSGLSARAIAFFVLAILLLVFMLENTKEAKVHLFFWHLNLPLWFVIFGCALAGAILWEAFGAVRRHRRRKARKETRAKN
ncbi:MAG: DUF1049 domain-containing protein [Acidimicrobiia bacterium]|nr:DUF1049 domain-containing protein [Acidimicrobiia bacterium]